VSTYAVFGMSRHRAVEIARRTVPTVKGPANYAIALSVDEWEAEVQTAADGIMASQKVVQLSEKFDAPSFAREFLAIAKRDGAIRLHIKAHCENGTDPVTKRPKYHWTENFPEPPPRTFEQAASS
jgi:hypothetical protein